MQEDTELEQARMVWRYVTHIHRQLFQCIKFAELVDVG